MRLFLSILGGCALTFGVVVAVVFSSAAPDATARQLVAWCVGHFLWLQDQGVTTVAFHNWLYQQDNGAGMMVLVWSFYGLLIGLVLWLIGAAIRRANRPRLPDIETMKGVRIADIPQGHGPDHRGGYIGLRRGSSH